MVQKDMQMYMDVWYMAETYTCKKLKIGLILQQMVLAVVWQLFIDVSCFSEGLDQRHWLRLV